MRARKQRRRERRVHDGRRLLAEQRQIDALRACLPREPVTGADGVPVTLRVDRRWRPLGEGLMKRGDVWRLLLMVGFSGLLGLLEDRCRSFTVYAFPAGRRRLQWHYRTELEALRAAALLVDDLIVKGMSNVDPAMVDGNGGGRS